MWVVATVFMLLTMFTLRRALRLTTSSTRNLPTPPTGPLGPLETPVPPRA
jgi:hypothetical protein